MTQPGFASKVTPSQTLLCYAVDVGESQRIRAVSRSRLKLERGGVKLILFICDVIKHSGDRLLSLESQSRLSKMQRRLEKCP